MISKAAQRSFTAALASNAKCELTLHAGCRNAFSRHGCMHFDKDAARMRREEFEFFSRSLA